MSLEKVYRSREFSIEPTAMADDSMIRMTASTEAPVQTPIDVDGQREMWDEILEHKMDSVDFSAAKALLLNHDSDQIVGTVRTISFDGNTSEVQAEILEGARLTSGVLVRDAVRSGALRGVSIGYTYRMSPEDVDVDYEAKRVCVRKWRLLEVTLTPIPADAAAGVRTLNMRAPSLKPTTTEVSMTDVTDIKKEDKTIDVESVRSEMAKVVTLAESHKLRGSDYVGLSLEKAQGKMLEDIAARDAAAGAQAKVVVRSHIEVGEEASEKVAKRAVGALLHNAGFTAAKHGDFVFEDGTKLREYQDGNTLRSKTMTDIIRATIGGVGAETRDMDNHALAAIALGKRDAANVSTGYFSTFVFANLMKKAVAVGYAMGGRSIRYQDLVGRNYVPDYKQFAVGALGVGNLQVTAENQAFPELDKAEGAYFDRVSMWGGTISLSEQAIVSDDTGRFMENIRMAGTICQKTIDKQVFNILLAGPNSTWAGASAVNTTSGATIVNSTNDAVVQARANLGKTRAALMNKLGLDGNPLGTIPAFLVVGPTLEHTTNGLLGIAPGQQNNTNIPGLQVVASPWLEFAGFANNSATNYFLIADPSEASGLILSTINGIDSPKVEQYDPGAVAAYKWKIYMPFAVGFSQATYAANTVVAGVQRGTI